MALVQPDGEIATAYQAAPQFDDFTYGTDASGQSGYLAQPTPGEPNSALALPGPILADVGHVPINPMPMEDITITVRVTARGESTVNQVNLKSRVD